MRYARLGSSGLKVSRIALDDYVLATRVCLPMGPGPNDGGLSRKHILAAIDDSLSRLGTDHVDLYQGVGCIPWSPLTRGLLAGNRERGGQQRTVRAGNDPLADKFYGDDDFDTVDTVHAVAAERGLPAAQIALAWLLGKPAVTAPIVGATKLHHLHDAIAALDVTLREDEVARLEAPYRPHQVLGHH